MKLFHFQIQQNQNQQYHPTKSQHQLTSDQEEWFQCCQQGQESFIRKNILKYAGKVTKDKKSGLIIAIENNQKNIVKLLLPYERNMKDKYGNNALMIAIQNKRDQLYEVLYTLSPYINKNDNSMAVTIAAQTCQLKLFSKLLLKEKQLAKITQRHMDALCGNIRSSNSLNLYGNENTQGDIQERIPLIYFMFNQHNQLKQRVTDIIHQLLPLQYSPDKYGLYPIHYAIILDFKQVFDVLLNQCETQKTQKATFVLGYNIKQDQNVYDLLQQFNRDWIKSNRIDTNDEQLLSFYEENDDIVKSQNMMLRTQNSVLSDKFTSSQTKYIQLDQQFKKQAEYIQSLKQQIIKFQTENKRLQNIISVNQIQSTEELQASNIYEKNQYEKQLSELRIKQQQTKQEQIDFLQNQQIKIQNIHKQLLEVKQNIKYDILSENKTKIIFESLQNLQERYNKSASYDDELISLQQKLDQKLQEIEQLKDQLDQQDQDHKQEMDDLVIDAAKIQENLQEEQKLTDQLKTQNQSLQNQNKAYQDELQQLKDQLKLQQEQNKQLNDQIVQKMNLITQIDDQMNKIQINNNQLQEQLIQKDIIISQLKSAQQ